jgi:hypothetical protein
LHGICKGNVHFKMTSKSNTSKTKLPAQMKKVLLALALIGFIGSMSLTSCKSKEHCAAYPGGTR